MLSKKQKEDCAECDRMMDSGKDPDCTECSCSVCLAQVTTGYSKKEINTLLDGFKSNAEELLTQYDSANGTTSLALLCDKMAEFCNGVIEEINKIVEV